MAKWIGLILLCKLMRFANRLHVDLMDPVISAVTKVVSSPYGLLLILGAHAMADYFCNFFVVQRTNNVWFSYSVIYHPN